MESRDDDGKNEDDDDGDGDNLSGDDGPVFIVIAEPNGVSKDETAPVEMFVIADGHFVLVMSSETLDRAKLGLRLLALGGGFSVVTRGVETVAGASTLISISPFSSTGMNGEIF